MTPAQFLTELQPSAHECERSSCVPAPFTIAQAALESGWGTSQLSVKAYNLFGVKADLSWHGDTIIMPTREFIKGQWITVQAKWRKYDSWLSAMLDHAKFLTTNHRYAHALTITDPVKFAQEIQRAGYATDPNYANKIILIMRSNKLL